MRANVRRKCREILSLLCGDQVPTSPHAFLLDMCIYFLSAEEEEVQPWLHIMKKDAGVSTAVRQYAKFLKERANIIRKVPEFEGNYSIER